MNILTFQQLYTRFQNLSSDTDSDTLTLAKGLINDGIKKCYAVLNAEYFYTPWTDLTVDGQNSYPLPFNCQKVHSLKTTISTTDYVAIEFPGSEAEWIALVGGSTTTGESSYPTYFFVKRHTYEIYPTASTDGYTMTMRYKRGHKDLSQADYITGTITTLANAGTAVTGSETTWTASFVGRFLRIDSDGEWYEISARSSNTAITIAREYGGTAIAAGAEAYTIGEVSLIPEPYQDAPVDFALWMYYLQKEKISLATIYKEIFQGLNNNFLGGKLLKIKEYGSNLTTSGVIDEDVVVPYYPDWPTGIS